jgi:hypothetical protein
MRVLLALSNMSKYVANGGAVLGMLQVPSIMGVERHAER